MKCVRHATPCLMPTLHTPHTHGYTTDTIPYPTYRYTTDTIQVHQKDFIHLIQPHHRYHTCTSETLHTLHTHTYTTDTIQVHQKDFIPHILTGTPQIPYRYIRKTSYPTYSHLHHRYHTGTSERLHTLHTHTYTTDTIRYIRKTSYLTYSHLHHRNHTGTSERLHTPNTGTPQIPYRYIRNTSYPTYSHLHHRYHTGTSERRHTSHTHTYTTETQSFH